MFFLKIIIYLIWLTVNRAIPQINLEYTNENIDEFRHNCLSMVVDPLNWENDREIITVCMSELPSKFTFDQLAKQNITSEQLYLWQTPIDTIEDYQLYLTSNNSSLTTRMFYNCTLPRFGPKCQYQLNTYDFSNPYVTCYQYLECNRGPLPTIAQPGFLEQWANLHYDQKVEWTK